MSSKDERRVWISEARPPIVSDAVLCAAYDRGISTTKIARCLGVTRERIRQRLQRQGRETAVDCEKGERSRRRTLPRSGLKIFCRVCGIEFERNWGGEGFCSHKCLGLHTRVLTREDILSAIEMRQSGSTWTGISRIFKTPIQTIQKNIWHLLNEDGRLTTQVVWGIWRPPAGVKTPPAWRWLIKQTGLSPR